MTLLPFPPPDHRADTPAADAPVPAKRLAWILAEHISLVHSREDLKIMFEVIEELWPEDDPRRPTDQIELMRFGYDLTQRTRMSARQVALFLLVLTSPQYFADPADLSTLESHLPPAAYRFAAAFDGGDGLRDKEDFYAECDEMIAAVTDKKHPSELDGRPARLRSLVDRYFREDFEANVQMFRVALWACLWHLPFIEFARAFAVSKYLLDDQLDLRIALEEEAMRARRKAQAARKKALATPGDFTHADAHPGAGGHGQS